MTNDMRDNYEDDDEYEPCSKKIMPSLFAWFLLISATSAYFTLVLPMCLDIVGLERINLFCGVAAFHAVLFFFVVLNFSIATFMDPGRFPKIDLHDVLENEGNQPQPNGNYKNVLINDINVRMKWCTTCQFYRPPRSSHCGVCNACIDTMDHHCPWVCNCIARRNYKYFLQFLISLTIHMLIILGVSIGFVLLNKENLTNIPVIVAMLLIIIIGVLIIPIGGLTGFHIILVSRGRTTNEQVTGKFRTGVNPFDTGFIHNWRLALFSSTPPSYIQFRRKRLKLKEQLETKMLLVNSNNRLDPRYKNKSININNSKSLIPPPSTHNQVKYINQSNGAEQSVTFAASLPQPNELMLSVTNEQKSNGPKNPQSKHHQKKQQINNDDLEMQLYLENKKLQEEAQAAAAAAAAASRLRNNYNKQMMGGNQQHVWLDRAAKSADAKNYDNVINNRMAAAEHQPKNAKKHVSATKTLKEQSIINTINNHKDPNKNQKVVIRNNSYINANHDLLHLQQQQQQQQQVLSKKSSTGNKSNGIPINEAQDMRSSSTTSTSSLLLQQQQQQQQQQLQKQNKSKKSLNNHNHLSDFKSNNKTSRSKSHHSNNNNNTNYKMNANNEDDIFQSTTSSQDYATYEITV